MHFFRNDNIEVNDCFWISEKYYDDFLLLYNSKLNGIEESLIPIVDASSFN